MVKLDDGFFQRLKALEMLPEYDKYQGGLLSIPETHPLWIDFRKYIDEHGFWGTGTSIVDEYEIMDCVHNGAFTISSISTMLHASQHSVRQCVLENDLKQYLSRYRNYLNFTCVIIDNQCFLGKTKLVSEAIGLSSRVINDTLRRGVKRNDDIKIMYFDKLLEWININSPDALFYLDEYALEEEKHEFITFKV